MASENPLPMPGRIRQTSTDLSGDVVMPFQTFIQHKKFKPVLVGVLVALLGWQLSWLPFGQPLTNLSYDFPFLFSESAAPRGVVLVEMDEISYSELRQNVGKEWDRRLHSQLLNYLHADGAGVVVFDIVFTNPGTNVAADMELAQAIRAHGRTALATGEEKSRNTSGIAGRIIPPTDIFRDATTNWGPTHVNLGTDGVVRQICRGTEQMLPLAWIAASLEKSPALPDDGDHFKLRWLHYYGPGGTMAHVSYSQATNQARGFYRGKTVFIGGRPKTRFGMDEVDEFLTPWRLHGEPQISGLELVATQFLNLSRGDFLRRLSPGEEVLMLALMGIVVGGGLAFVRPLRAVVFAVIGMVAIVTFALVLFFLNNAWFNWSVVALVQIPAALAWSLAWHWRQLKKEKDWLETPMPNLWDDLPADKSSSTVTPASIKKSSPAIPDHEMLRQIGRGAYGDVWLARDALGSFHAVKIVRRVVFEHAGPYEREFRGLQRFTPISRAHPGLVHILHVGRNTTEDYFYYVMEAGDDEKSGATIDPDSYTPRNLGRDLHCRAPLPPRECIEIMTALCDALEFLHGQGLIHRDVKPANIIFVNGRPKLADIGLVTEINEHQNRASLVGTEGYLPPEGPGTASGDIFALGKVLGEMLRRETNTTPHPPDVARVKLESIIVKACAGNPAERFASAKEMREAMMRIDPQ